MTKRTLRARIRHDDVELLRFERRIADLATACYRKWAPLALDAALPSLTADAFGAGLPPDLDAIMLTQEQWEAVLQQTFMPGIEQLMAERIAARLEEDGVEIPEPSITAPPVAPITPGVVVPEAAAALYRIPSVRDWQEQYLSEVRNRMSNTPTTVFREISASIDKGLAKGEGYRDLAGRVQDFLDTGLDDWHRRAETIARTEATGAFNAATQSAAEVRQQVYGIELDKVWVATIDSRTRKTHFAADGQRRKLSAPFRVGKSDLRYPGDSRGRAEEVINCRCTFVEVDVDDEIPGELDRQTERSETDATVRNRIGQQVGDIQGEVDRRREDEGVIRARDDEDGEGLVAASTQQQEDSSMRRTWTGILAPIGKPTGDSRIIKKGGKIEFREFPQPLNWQKVSSDGHMQSVVIGGILEASVSGDEIIANGFLLETPEAAEASELLAEGLIRPSIDPADVVWEMVDENGDEIDWMELEEAWMRGEDIKVLDQFAEMTVMGATLVNFPAFAEAKIELDPEDADDETIPDDDEVKDAEASLVASVAAAAQATDRGYYVEDRSLFDDPKFDRPTGLHMTEDGRIQGHLALWGTCHLGSQPGQCRQPPQSLTDYAFFHVSEIGTPEGPLPVGKLTVGGGHAGPKLGLQAALEHYDNAASAFAFVRAGQDSIGIWISGVPMAGVDKETLSEGLASPLSGDWRRAGGNLEMIAALAVNSPGFPVPRGYRNDEGQEYSLVASNAVKPEVARTSKSSVQAVVDRAASLAATAAVEAYAKRQDREQRLAATQAKIRDRQLAKVAATAQRLGQ